MLIGMVGSDRVLFGTGTPGSGSAANPETGKSFDDIKPLLDSIEFFSAEDKADIFEENARRIFPRLQIERARIERAGEEHGPHRFGLVISRWADVFRLGEHWTERVAADRANPRHFYRRQDLYVRSDG